MTRYTLDIGLWWVIGPILVQVFGLGFVFVPLATVTFEGVLVCGDRYRLYANYKETDLARIRARSCLRRKADP